MPYTVAVDLDGPIFEVYWESDDFHNSQYRVNKFGKLVHGAKYFLKKLRKDGHRIIIHTCRTNPTANHGRTMKYLAQLVRDELNKYGIPFDEVWSGEGKPLAQLYIDDRAVRFTAWHDVQEFLERDDE